MTFTALFQLLMQAGHQFRGYILGPCVFQRFVIEDQAVVAAERATLLNTRNLQYQGIKGAR